MMHAKVLLVAILAVCSAGCTTTYWVDRGRDGLDVVSITMGVGFGAKGKAGPLTLGTGMWGDLVGLRRGCAFSQEEGNRVVEIQLPFNGLPFECASGAEAFEIDDAVARDRHKLGKSGTFYVLFSGSEQPVAYTEIEGVIALGPSVRVTLNPVEFLDFALGWFGVDIYDDDLERRKRNNCLAQAGSNCKR